MTGPPPLPRARSRTSVENRPFLCQPPMSQSSCYGRCGGGVGHQRVLQLLSCGPHSCPLNIVLWGIEGQLCTDRVGGRGTETGLLTPVLQHPSSVHRHKRGESIIPRGDRFPLGRGSGPVAKTGSVCCARSRQSGRANVWPLRSSRCTSMA